MVIGFVYFVEQSFERFIGFRGKEEDVLATKEETPIVNKDRLVLCHSHLHCVATCFTGIDWRRGISVIKRVPFRERDFYFVFLRPGEVKVDLVFSGAGCEQRANALFKKRRLQKEPLAGALRILGHPDMILVPERPDRVGSILDRNVRQFGGAQTALHCLFQIFLALSWRVVVVERFPFDGQMPRVLDGDIAFERAVLVQAQVRDARFPGFVGRRQRRLYPDGRIIGNQGIDTFFLPAQHSRREVMKPGIVEFPAVADANRDVRGTQRAGNHHVPIKESLAPIRRQSKMRVKAGGVRQGRKQEIDIDRRTNATLKSISRLLVLFQFPDFFPGVARALVTGVFFSSFSSGVLAPATISADLLFISSSTFK